jgi:hypothetical protein
MSKTGFIEFEFFFTSPLANIICSPAEFQRLVCEDQLFSYLLELQFFAILRQNFILKVFLEKHSYIRFRFTSCYLNMHI